MPFPESEVPTTRSFKAGTWSVQSFKSMSGSETRILYGDKQVGAELVLTYRNISDNKAKEFFDHFSEMKGIYQSFVFQDPQSKAKAGWDVMTVPPETKYLSPDLDDAAVIWRYKEPPQMRNVYPGYSDVTVTLVGVTRD
jgi:hypothetical protein